MSDTLTIILSGRTSVLEASFFPPIELAVGKNYVLGLVDFYSFHSIPNIQEGRNKFYLQTKNPTTIPTGSCEIRDIEEYLVDKI